MNVLVVDDEPGIRTSLSKIVTRAGHQVTVAGDGSQALQCVARANHALDLIITDNAMPVMSGAEFVRRMRTTCHAMRVIVFSGHLTPADEQQYREMNVEKILRKPFGFKELVLILSLPDSSST